MSGRAWLWATAAVLLLGAAAAVAVLPAFGRLRIAAINLLPERQRIAVWALLRGVQVDHDVVVTAPDGTRLATSLFLPRRRDGALPTVLIRTPYDRLRDMDGYWWALHFARHGYAAVVQDLRGTGGSGGELLPWRDAGTDGTATLDWIARQPWSDGKVGTYGCSALGETQYALARLHHPAHRAMIPSGAGGAIGSASGRHGYFGLFEGGVFQLASGFGWFSNAGAKDPSTPPARPHDVARHLTGLPVSQLVAQVRPGPNGFIDLLHTPLGDPQWEQWGYWSERDQPAVPAMVINTWGDQTVGDALALAGLWQKAGVPQKVVIAPGDHCLQGRAPAPGGDRPDSTWETLALRWFDHWLKGTPDALADLPAYSFYMLDEERWLGSAAWPPAESRPLEWHLHSAGRANTRNGDGQLLLQPAGSTAADVYRYDPANPVPTRGGPICCTGNPNEPTGAVDQRDVEVRDDVLVYTSPPLEQDLRIAGPLRAHVVVSTSVPDTDLVLRLVHVRPDGLATNIQEGALRLRYRDGFTQPRLLAPGEKVAVTVDLRAIAYRVPRGHRLRLQLTSSNFPRLERNLNTGAAVNADETRLQVATTRIHHGGDDRSYVEMNVLPAGS